MSRVTILILLLISTPAFCKKLFDPNPELEKDTTKKVKIEHAEPVVNDLVTDLGSEKGDFNVNLSANFASGRTTYTNIDPQLEIEYAPLRRFAVEVQIPYNIYFKSNEMMPSKHPDYIPNIQFTTQYTFYINPKRKISMAGSYRYQLQFRDPATSEKKGIENLSHFPFLIAAKNWNDKYHLMIMAGTQIVQPLDTNQLAYSNQITTAFHKKIGNNNYVGIEVNKVLEEAEFGMVARPQAIYAVSEKLNVGLAVSIPFWYREVRWGAFLRITRSL
ncbi:MAG TPA: HAEPLYID family protein [Cytophagaceae bacterium]|jgi:hypothetical protein